MANTPNRRYPLSGIYRPIGVALNDLYSHKPAPVVSANLKGQTKLDVTIATIWKHENSRGQRFHIPEFTKLILQDLDSGAFPSSYDWSNFDRDFGTLRAVAQEKLDDLSAFLRGNFKAAAPVPVIYDTKVDPSGPDVSWTVGTDSSGKPAIMVTYVCTS